MKPIAHIKSDFKEKFGIPRQSGLVDTVSKIIFEKEFRVSEAFSGLSDFSHIWILWEFSKAKREKWSPTVRPPLLGGNKRMGVFATRSPYRPNNIGLSCVKLIKITHTKDLGPVLYVSGADLLDNTPIFDIKPYLPYTDSVPDAKAGFTENLTERKLNVTPITPLFFDLDSNMQETIIKILAQDPRPSYKDDENEYGLRFADYEIKFCVKGDTLFLNDIAKV